MKKITVYTTRPSWTGVRDTLRDKASYWLFFIIFLCGIALGTVLYRADSGGFFTRMARAFLLADMKSVSVWIAVGAVVSLLLSVICGFSCFGITLSGLLPFGCGMVNALAASEMIAADPARGLGRFTLLLLPGAVFTATALICLCGVSAQASKIVAANVFRGKSERVELKEYAVKSLICFFIMLIGIPVNYLTAALFAGLFGTE